MRHESIVHVPVKNGIESIACTRVGQMCVHRTLHDTALWKVTHFISGSAIPGDWDSYDNAWKAAQSLDALGDWDNAVARHSKGESALFHGLRVDALKTLKDMSGREPSLGGFTTPQDRLAALISENRPQ